MILVFGGTTEGKEVAEMLDFLSESYYYSTKTKVSPELKGKRISGAMDQEQMIAFCKDNAIRLIIDAAHPFAIQLHENIFQASVTTEIPVIRFERNYPAISASSLIRIFSSFPEMVETLQNSSFQNILALTGVQTIPWFKSLKPSINCYFRILDSEQSIQMARSFGVHDNFILPAQPNGNDDELIALVKQTKAEVILTKESGDSGFFPTKVNTSEKLNIPLWVVTRPALPKFTYTISSSKELLQTIYLIKKTILKSGTDLRSGFTTGTCVTACAKACFLAITEQKVPSEVSVQLPDGSPAAFKIFPEELSKDSASCIVIKDAGDDPDVTHAKEIGCRLRTVNQPGVRFIRGKGIGMVTMPGLQLPVGEPAINPVPCKMITDMLESFSALYETDCGFEVEPFVPEGEEIARQTFNSRVGVIGGISIIGTSGKVIPYSNEAFLTTIRYQLSVAVENGLDEIVLTAGKRSENTLKPYIRHLPEIAYIHYGNSIGETLQMAANTGFNKINLGLMLGKAVKLAEGHLDTHSHKVSMNIGFIMQVARECNYPEETIQELNQQTLANAIPSIIPFSSKEPFYKSIALRCFQVCKRQLKDDTTFRLFLISDKDEIVIVGK
jgi:cobalt-precorrin-5B (C1)-methyltransferase